MEHHNVGDQIQQKYKERNPSHIALRTFLGEKGCEVPKGSGNLTFVDQRCKKNYRVPAPLIPEFYDLLEKCRKDGIELGFAEGQYSVSEESGIFIDLDIKQTSAERLWDNEIYSCLAGVINDILHDSLSSNEVERYKMHFLDRAEVERETDTTYKDGIHIIIPEIRVSKAYKIWFMKTLASSTEFASHFSDARYINPMKFVDLAVAHNYITMFGCAKANHKPYLYAITQVFNFKTNKFAAAAPVDAEKMGLNMSYELSLAHDSGAGYQKRFKCEPKEGCSAAVQEAATVSATMNEGSVNLSINDMDDPTFNYVARLIDIMNPKRAADFDTWKPIIIALAKLDMESSSDYRPLAYRFSAKDEVGWKKPGAIEGIANLWKWTQGQANFAQLPGLGKIYKAAKEDNPEECKRVRENTPASMLTNVLIKADGSLPDYDAAQVLFSIFSEKFFYDNYHNTWYEFTTKRSRGLEQGQLFKYVERYSPTLLQTYIMEKLPGYIDSVILFYQKIKDNSKDEGQVKWYKNIIAKLCRTRDACKSMTKSEAILRACKIVFAYTKFRETLNKDEGVIGVGNGVIELGEECKLIEGRHPYHISFYTNIPYEPSNLSVDIKCELLGRWRETFIEPDVQEYYLLYFGETLCGFFPEPKVHVWEAPGRNAKSTWMMLHALTLGRNYAAKMVSSFYTQPPPRAEHHTSHMMCLGSARWIYTSETKPGDNLHAETVKYITSGEHAILRELNEKSDNYAIIKVRAMIGTNHRMGLSGDLSYGTTRRIMVYRIKVTFVDDPKLPNELPCDPSFQKTKIHDVRYQQAWLEILIEYYQKLCKEYKGNMGYVRSETLARETQDYVNSQDSISNYLSIKIVKSGGLKIRLTDLISNYIDWYKNNVKFDKSYLSNVTYINNQFMNATAITAFIRKVEGSNDWYIVDHQFCGGA